MIGSEGTLERLLRWAVGNAEAAEGLLGDLAEEHSESGAGAWRYRLALLGVVMRYAPTRLAGQDAGDVVRAVRFTLRSLARAPSFAAVTVATLALGIGATGAAFTVLRSVVFEPLSYENANRLVRLESAVPGLAPDTRWHLAKAQYRDLQDNATSLEQIGLYVFNVTTIGADGGAGRTAQRARTVMANPSLFHTLSITLPLGRAFTEPESLARAPVAILSDRYWERAFGRDPIGIGNDVGSRRLGARDRRRAACRLQASRRGEQGGVTRIV
jgi:hypothetical protein